MTRAFALRSYCPRRFAIINKSVEITVSVFFFHIGPRVDSSRNRGRSINSSFSNSNNMSGLRDDTRPSVVLSELAVTVGKNTLDKRRRSAGLRWTVDSDFSKILSLCCFSSFGVIKIELSRCSRPSGVAPDFVRLIIYVSYLFGYLKNTTRDNITFYIYQRAFYVYVSCTRRFYVSALLMFTTNY